MEARWSSSSLLQLGQKNKEKNEAQEKRQRKWEIRKSRERGGCDLNPRVGKESHTHWNVHTHTCTHTHLVLPVSVLYLSLKKTTTCQYTQKLFTLRRFDCTSFSWLIVLRPHSYLVSAVAWLILSYFGSHSCHGAFKGLSPVAEPPSCMTEHFHYRLVITVVKSKFAQANEVNETDTSP